MREQLVEGIVVGDDDLMERYLEGDVLSSAGARRTLAARRGRRAWCSRWCAARRPPGSASTGWPPCWPRSPRPRLAARRSRSGPATRSTRSPATPPASPWPRCSRPSPTPTSARSRSCAVLSGTDPARHRAHRTPAPTPTSGSTSCSSCGARRAQPVDEAQAGDIVAVPKLADTATGDTLAPKGTPVVVPPRRAPSRWPCPSPSGPSPRATRTSS